MKTRKNLKLLILVLSLTLLIGSVFAVTASAAEAETGELAGLSINHGDTISIAFVVKATQAEIENKTVEVKYTWEGGSEQTATFKTDLGDGYVRVVTNGVAAYDLGKTLTFTVYTNGEAGETGTYSVATFLYNMLYRDGATGSRKDCYEALLQYGATSQIYLEKNQENLVTEIDYAYTKNENIKLNGKSYVIGSNSVTATYSGGSDVAAWIINGTRYESTATTYTVTVDGVTSVNVEISCDHVDTDPKDHVCDNGCGNELVGGECADGDNNHKCEYCGKVLSECVDTDSDHVCDICGDTSPCYDDDEDHDCDLCGERVDCYDKNSDGRCDICKDYSFNGDLNDGVNDVNVGQAQSNSATVTEDTIISSNSVTSADRTPGYDYGAYFSIANDPTGAANKVLKVEALYTTDGEYSALNSYVTFKPTGTGNTTVFDFDMYVSADSVTNCETVNVILVDETFDGFENEDEVNGQGYQKITFKIDTQSTVRNRVAVAGKALPSSMESLNVWISYRIIINAAANTYSIYYSTDGNVYKCISIDYHENVSPKYGVDLSKLTAVGFKACTYRDGEDGVHYENYIDNVDLYREDHFTFNYNGTQTTVHYDATGDGDHTCDFDGCGATDVTACADINPLDHKCDDCRAEGVSDCVDSDKDHRCDICGVESSCIIAEGEYACSICGNIPFDKDMTSGNDGVDITYTISNSTNSTSSGAILDSSCINKTTVGVGATRESGYDRGTFYSIKADPTDASNNVLSVHTNSPTKTYDENFVNYIKVAPKETTGRFIMLETRIYVEAAGAANTITLCLNAYDDNFNGTSFVDNGDGTYVRGVEPTEGVNRIRITCTAKCTASTADTSSATLSVNGTSTDAIAHQWVDYKYIIDTQDNKYYVFYSVDGENFTAVVNGSGVPTNNSYYMLDTFENVKYMGIEGWTGSTATQVYVDNLRVTRSDSVTFDDVALGGSAE